MIHLLVILAVWRLSSLLQREDGPFEVFLKMRKEAKKVTSIFKCFWCVSIWVALPFAAFSENVLIYWLAYSAGAILLDEIMETLDNVRKV